MTVAIVTPELGLVLEELMMTLTRVETRQQMGMMVQNILRQWDLSWLIK